jgi:hypothetical protein
LVALLGGVGIARGVLSVTVARNRTEGPLVLEKHVGFAAMAGCRKIRANMAEEVCITGLVVVSVHRGFPQMVYREEGKQPARLNSVVGMFIPEM